MGKLKIKRVYEPLDPQDGYRILIDRLWPRGMKKEAADADIWLKAIAPSAELRKWYDHDPEKWPEFSRKYISELKKNPAAPELLDMVKQYKVVTFLYAGRDEQHTHALVLQHYIQSLLNN
jgi:uncharacterized protein YeaO (DUF488 family)